MWRGSSAGGAARDTDRTTKRDNVARISAAEEAQPAGLNHRSAGILEIPATFRNWRMSLAASASSQSRKVTIFGRPTSPSAEDPVDFEGEATSAERRTSRPLIRSKAASVVRASAMPGRLMAASIAMLGRLSTGPCVTCASGEPPPACQRVSPSGSRVDERMLEDGLRPACATPGHSLDCTRETVARAKLHGVESRPVAVAMADCEIDFLAGEIHMMRVAETRKSMPCGLDEMAEPMHEPFRGEIR